ncbi:hypothetical protein GY45DRAFT_251778 [Cubamyces sp. BRFM 1775]|nr:hypothetical protein GY45DRAFT_251778 [Cubamyces sp. BRFM 1775]
MAVARKISRIRIMPSGWKRKPVFQWRDSKSNRFATNTTNVNQSANVQKSTIKLARHLHTNCASATDCYCTRRPAGTVRRADARSSCSIWSGCGAGGRRCRFSGRRQRPSSATRRDEPCLEPSASAFASPFSAPEDHSRLPASCVLRAWCGVCLPRYALPSSLHRHQSQLDPGSIVRRSLSGSRPLNVEWGS